MSNTAYISQGKFVLSSAAWASLDFSQLPKETLEALSPRSPPMSTTISPTEAAPSGSNKAQKNSGLPRGVYKKDAAIKKERIKPTTSDWARLFREAPC